MINNSHLSSKFQYIIFRNNKLFHKKKYWRKTELQKRAICKEHKENIKVKEISQSHNIPVSSIYNIIKEDRYIYVDAIKDIHNNSKY